MGDLRAQIEAAGGLVTAAEMARRWGISRERVRKMSRRAGFPAPVTHIGKSPVWVGGEVDAWRKDRLQAVEHRPLQPSQGQ